MNFKFQISNFRVPSNVQPTVAEAMVGRNRTSNVFYRNIKPQTSNIKLIIILLFIFLFPISCSDPPISESPRPRVEAEQAQPARIISLAPSVTEVLFAMGLGDRVVGVTRYCRYPPEAREKLQVGGYFDVNYEAILALEPDLVIHLLEHQDAQERIGDLGIELLAVDHSRVEGILESFSVIADYCGMRERGATLRGDLERRMEEVRNSFSSASPPALSSVEGRLPVPAFEGSRPRVLVAVGRSLQPGGSGEVYISGRDGFYDDLIRLAGGENAYGDETLKFPALSAEGLVRLDPDVIIEMVPDISPGADHSGLLSRWNEIPGLRAASINRIHIIGGGHCVVPGPRFVELLEEMGEVINRVEN
jgi:iron complex transport system substrate-binding protein